MVHLKAVVVISTALLHSTSALVPPNINNQHQQQPILLDQPASLQEDTSPSSSFTHSPPVDQEDEEQDYERPRRPLPRSCSTAPSVPGDRRPVTGEFTLMNFNAEWLFVEGGTGGVVCPGRGCPWKSMEMGQRHLHRVANTIASLALPDIVHLTEVEGCTALESLISVLEKSFGARPGLYKPYLIPGRDTATGQNVGLITKIDPTQDLIRTDERVEYPIEGSSCEWSDPDEPKWLYGASKNYMARFVVDGIGFMLSGNHFLAFPDKRDRCEKREAQAAVISKLVSSHLHARSTDEVIVLGDLNDFDDEVLDAAGAIDRPISKALYTIRHATTPPLYNLAHMWDDQMERYSNWFDRNGDCKDNGGDEHTLIDHILVSDGLRKRVIETFPLHNYTEYCGKIDSDHWPLFVRFDTTTTLRD